MNAPERIGYFLDKRKSEGIFRQLTVSDGLIDFSSNDYLGFSRSAWVAQQTAREMERMQSLPQSATASRLLNGNTLPAEELEYMLAAFHRGAAGLLFNSGYDANLALISSLARAGDHLYIDERAHASVHQGAKLSAANVQLFPHNDTAGLAAMLSAAGVGAVKWVVTESVFSMDGDRAPLRELSATCQQYGAELIVDEAHATGLFGPQGSGLCVAEDMASDCFARVYTFGKAIGANGAVVVGSSQLRAYLVNFAKPLIYSTALPLHSLLRIRSAYRFLHYSDRPGQRLLQLMAHFSSIKDALPYEVTGDGPVFSLIVPGNDRVKALATALQERGFDIRPIVSPTVPKGRERIRISLHSFNTVGEIDALAVILAALTPEIISHA
jgi:8-amino-7-oxononanoate synthase